VYKVFALLEELEAMKTLGLAAPRVEEAELVAEFLNWSSESPQIRQIADGLRDKWSKELWFFQVLKLLKL
jgi:hypothetical protein